MRKQIISLMLALAMLFTLTACGGQSAETATATPSASASAAEVSEAETAEASETQESETAQVIEAQEPEVSEPAAETPAESKAAGTEGGGILIVYFTWSGNTAEMAAYISDKTGGDLLEIEPGTPYPEDYNETGELAKVERDENQRPAIANLPESLDGYDTIFIGYPIWWHTAPMIIGTFLESYDLTGINIYPFSQSSSMDTEQFENSMEFVRNSAGSGTVHDGLFARAANTEAIDAYLTGNGFPQLINT